MPGIKNSWLYLQNYTIFSSWGFWHLFFSNKQDGAQPFIISLSSHAVFWERERGILQLSHSVTATCPGTWDTRIFLHPPEQRGWNHVPFFLQNTAESGTAHTFLTILIKLSKVLEVWILLRKQRNMYSWCVCVYVFVVLFWNWRKEIWNW